MLTWSCISFAGSVIISVTYGITVKPYNDPYIATAERAAHAMTVTANAGAYWVDSFPMCKSSFVVL